MHPLTTETRESTIRGAIAEIENADAWDWKRDPQRLSGLKAELAEIEAEKPEGLSRAVIAARQQRDASHDFVMREIARLRRLRAEGRADASLYDPEMFAVHRKLHGKSCRKLRVAQARRAAYRISSPANIVAAIMRRSA